MDKFLSGIDDVPPVEDDKCCRCGEPLTKENFSDWFVFVKVGSQMYQMPICDECDKKQDANMEKADD